jgi:hypothetical protein
MAVLQHLPLSGSRGISGARRRWAANGGTTSPTTLVGTLFRLAPHLHVHGPTWLILSQSRRNDGGAAALESRGQHPRGERLLQAGGELSPLGAAARGTGRKFPREQRRTAGFLFHCDAAMRSPHWRDSYSSVSVARTNNGDINGPLRPPQWRSKTTPSLHSLHPCAGTGDTWAPEATSTTGSTSARTPRPPPQHPAESGGARPPS